MNQITEITRRNLFDEMSLLKINWAGRLGDVQFLSRIFDLKSLPSTDHRFQDAGQDIWQHRINNYDWEDDWVFYDHRFNLLYCDDKTFLTFLCETIHPIVHSDAEEVKKLLDLYNKHLRVDGFELIEYVRISERPVFKGKELSRAGKILQKVKEIEDIKMDVSDARQHKMHTSGVRQLRVFLCHASDDKSTARDLYKRFLKDNFDPWLDEKNILPGQDWNHEIKKAVRESDVVLVLVSSNSINKAGYVQKEIRQAIDVAEEQPEGAIFLIPVRLEDCPIPERLRHLQWVNFFENDGYDRLVRALKTRENDIKT